MSAKGLTMTVAAVAVAVGTYFGLETLHPPAVAQNSKDHHDEEVAKVFGGSLSAPASGSAESAQPVEASTTDMAAGGEPASDDVAMADASMPADAEGETSMSGEDMATEPAPATTDEAAMASDDGMATTEEAMPEMAMAGEPAPAPTAAPATPAPAAAPAPSKPARMAAAKPATKSAPQKLTQWWGPASDDHLSVVYAGSAAYTRAIVLMLNGAFDDTQSADANVRVTDPAGKAVSGQWQIGANNKRMLLFPVTKAGTYTVNVKSTLTDRSGRTLAKALKGPVRVQ